MSDFTNTNCTSRDLRWQLLSTVSALSLLVFIYGSHKAEAAAGDAEPPAVWIELGGGLDQFTNQQTPFMPPFEATSPSIQTYSVSGIQHAPRAGFNLSGEIAYQPAETDWVFSAAAKFGRASRYQDVHDEGPTIPYVTGGGYVFPTPLGPFAFSDTVVKSSESHVILDFKAGKEIGLGAPGGGYSVLSAGVRFAQFISKAAVQISLVPINVGNSPRYYASAKTSRSFLGIGPSIAWDASDPLLNRSAMGTVTFDWGANAAILFGKQKSDIRQMTSEVGVYQTTAAPGRTKSIQVPNVGGFAGFSVRYADAKVSMGYRADFFFGAIDGGIDARKSENRGFYGPFANISFGIGG
jgi:hypothetical protein